MVQVTYAEPFLDGHNRMKEALAILGRIEEARCVPAAPHLGGGEGEDPSRRYRGRIAGHTQGAAGR